MRADKSPNNLSLVHITNYASLLVNMSILFCKKNGCIIIKTDVNKEVGLKMLNVV